jgi:hypothetical protein
MEETVATKQCSKCEQIKPLTEFYMSRGKLVARCRTCACQCRREYVLKNQKKVREQKREFYIKNADKIRAKTREWNEKNRERTRASAKRWADANKERRKLTDIEWRYGISRDQYLKAVKRQGGRCAICGAKNSGKRGLHIDHCHKTGLFRGLLCGNCNSAIGQFKENPSLLRNAIRYLEEFASDLAQFLYDSMPDETL